MTTENNAPISYDAGLIPASDKVSILIDNTDKPKPCFTAEELLEMMPKPIMCPTQREYGEDFYPKYERFYLKIRTAAGK